MTIQTHAGAAGPRYSGVAMALHWIVAIAVIANWRIAESAEHAGSQAARSAMMGNHFALGVLIFLAVLARLVWRNSKGVPPPQSGHADWENALAKLVHYLFYALLLVMPLAGWLAMSKNGSPISMWGIVEIPPLPVAPDPDGAKAIFEQHATAGTVLLGLIVVHILGTLKHTLIDKDGNLFRMVPLGTPRP